MFYRRTSGSKDKHPRKKVDTCTTTTTTTATNTTKQDNFMERKSKFTITATTTTTITTAQAASTPPQKTPPLSQISTPICALRFFETNNEGDEKVTQQVLHVPTNIGNAKFVFEAMVVAKQKKYSISG